MQLQHLIETAADRWPERAAFERGAERLSFGDLNKQSAALAAHLRRYGGRGMHIGVLAPNCTQYAVAYFAIAKAGGVIVPLAPATGAERLERAIRLGDVQLMLATQATSGMLTGFCDPLFSFEGAGGAAGLVVHRVRRTAARIPDAYDRQPALFLLTSGTSGEPKFVMLSNENVIGNMRAFLELARFAEDDRAIITLPLTSAGTNTTEFLAYICSGVTASLYPYAAFGAANYCMEVERTEATVANVTPFILKTLLQHAVPAAAKARSLKKVFCASSPLGAGAAIRLSEAFRNIEFHYGYGLTEAGPRCTMLDPKAFVAKPGSSGLPLRDVEVRIADESGAPAAVGTLGEALVRGPNVMLGYYRRPDETARTLRDGWLCTGDLARVDSHGHLYVTGRRNNRILTRGYTVSPEEVEEAILEHPAVDEAQAAGAPDDLLFERIIAYVALRRGRSLAARDLQAFLAERLAAYQRPSEIRFVERLARGETQKLLRRPREPESLFHTR